MRIKNRKKLNISCYVLIWFILFWIKGKDTLLLQFIKTYILFRMLPPAPYWCLRLSSGRDYWENIFGHFKQVISVRRSSLTRSLSECHRWTHGLKCVATGFDYQTAVWFCVAIVNSEWLSSQEPQVKFV